MIYTHGALERSTGVTERHGFTGGVSTAAAAASLHTTPHPAYGTHCCCCTSLQSWPPHPPCLSREMYLQILPEMTCCTSLLHSSKKGTQVVGSKCSGFIPAKGVALLQILLHLPIFSQYILYFFFNKFFFSHKFSKKARERLPSTVMAYKYHLEELSRAASTTRK